MPFVASRRLADLLDPDAGERAARGIADAGGDRLELNTRRNTPIDTSPFRDRPGRPRGALRESVHRGRRLRYVGPTGSGFRVVVSTDDPIAPHVEWRTRPHWITPRSPGGTLHWRGSDGGHRFAKRVWHPGTAGAHMFALGAMKTEAEVPEIAAAPLRDFERDLVPSRTGRVTDRRAAA